MHPDSSARRAPAPRINALYVVIALAAIVAYIALELALRHLVRGRQPIPFYPGAGIAMALLILTGVRGAPALMIARFLLLWVVPRGPITLAVALVVAIAQGAVFAAAATLVRRKVGRAGHDWTQREAGWLIGGLAAAAIGAAIMGNVTVLLTGSRLTEPWLEFTTQFALGDFTGELVVVPIVLFVIWPGVRAREQHAMETRPHDTSEWRRFDGRVGVSRLERVARVAAVLGSIALAGFTRVRTGQFGSFEEAVCLLVVFWIAQREGLRGSALSMALYGMACTVAFGMLTLTPSDTTEIQATLIVLSIGGLVIGAQRSTGIANDERYWHLLATSREGVWRLDERGQTRHVNEGMAGMLGLPDFEIIGREAREFIAPEALDQWLEAWSRRVTGQSASYETLILRNDGIRIPVLMTASAVRSSVTREIVGSVALVTNLTELRHAEASGRLARRLLESSFRTSRDAMIIFRAADEYILDVNDAWCKVTGNARADAVGHSQRELGIWADPEDAARLGQAIAEHGSVRDFEIRFNRHRVDSTDNEPGYALLSATPVEHEGDTYLLVAGRDITGDRRAEATKRVRCAHSSAPRRCRVPTSS